MNTTIRTIIALAATTAMSQAALTYVETVEVSDNNSEWDMSLYNGKAFFEDSSGARHDFGNGTVYDYALYESTSGFNNYANGSNSIITTGAVGNVTQNPGVESRTAQVWTTNDPDSLAANYTTQTIASPATLSGSIDISTISTGNIYFPIGTFVDIAGVTLTMKGAGQTDVVLNHDEPSPGFHNKVWMQVYDFSDVADYDTIEWTYHNADGDGSRARMAGVIVTTVPEPSSLALLGLGWLTLILRRRK